VEEVAPMRIASVRVKSANPEKDAWDKLKAWAEPRGLLRDSDRNPVFGYTAEPPKPGEREYAYEFWIAVDSDVEIRGDVTDRLFLGGMFAVAACTAPTPKLWKELWDSVESGGAYAWRRTHELERVLNPAAPVEDWTFELYLPIQPRR
jgi:DNA gyrase inhibitor GyrI